MIRGKQFLKIFLGAAFMAASCSHNDKAETTEAKESIFDLVSPGLSGVTFSNQLQENIFTHENVLTFDNYYNGGGVAVGDINNDGLPDVYFTGNTVSNKLYLNKGDFKFEDITDKAGVAANERWSNGVTMADVNDDGFLDIYVSCGGPSLEPKDRENLLYLNNGDQTFTESGKTYGINDSHWSNHSSFFDYDQDGDLDLFVMNHTTYWRVNIPKVVEIMKDTAKLLEATNHLYKNNGDGSFTDVTLDAGILNYGYGLGLVTVDINDDGLTDVYVANDYSVPDFMYINQGDGTFKDEQKQRTRQITYYGMGCDIADFNNDAEPEIVVVDMAISDHYRSKTLMASMNSQLFRYLTEYLKLPYQYMFNSFQLNNGNGKFSNIAHQVGIAKSDWSWAALLADFDGDTYKDLFISNGIRKYPRDNDFMMAMKKARDENGGSVPNHLKEELYQKMPSIPLENKYYKNSGQLQFEESTTEFGSGEASFSYGAAYADLDLDGDLDLLVNNMDDTAFVYQNNTLIPNYLSIKPVKENGSPYYNTKVKVYTKDKVQYQELCPVRGYYSSMEPTLFFSTAEVKKIDRIVFEWPDGSKGQLTDMEAGQTIKVSPKDVKELKAEDKVVAASRFLTEVDPAEYNIKFTHYDEPHNEYAQEILLPHSQGRLGPFSAVADVNGDGLEDLFLGGGKHQSGILYTQGKDGKFTVPSVQPWTDDFRCEDMEAAFFDYDNDGDLDLYVVSGGGSEMLQYGERILQDRLYQNDGSGNFSRAAGALPKMLSSGKVVSPFDYDKDGDIDLFVGGRTTPGKYPTAPQTYLLENNKGSFTDVTEQKAPGLSHIGMVTDQEWADINGDGKIDFVLTGEWMAPTVYINNGKSFENQTDKYGLSNYSGWWFSVTVADMNQDGKMDILAGNLGTNNKFNPSPDHPLYIYANDFDQSGNIDIVLAKDYKKDIVPVRGRECSSQQMPFIKEKFETYSAFANASLEEIYGEQNLDKAIQYSVTHFHSGIFWNNGKSFAFEEFPQAVQKSPINDILVKDLNEDQLPDLILAGNLYNTEPETPRYDAGNGEILLNSGDKKFKAVSQAESGFYLPTDAKDLQLLKLTDNKTILIAMNNSDKLNIFTLIN